MYLLSRYKDHIIRGGCGENASECFLLDLDQSAEHKVFNLSSLCKAELIFTSVPEFNLCEVAVRDLCMKSLLKLIFTLSSLHNLSATAALCDLVLSLLTYNKWTLS